MTLVHIKCRDGIAGRNRFDIVLVMVFDMVKLRLESFGAAKIKYIRCLQEEVPEKKITLDDSIRVKEVFRNVHGF